MRWKRSAKRLWVERAKRAEGVGRDVSWGG